MSENGGARGDGFSMSGLNCAGLDVGIGSSGYSCSGRSEMDWILSWQVLLGGLIGTSNSLAGILEGPLFGDFDGEVWWNRVR